MSSGSTTEYLDVVNEEDNIVDKQTRQKCIEQGLLHRAVVVFLKNDRGKRICRSGRVGSSSIRATGARRPLATCLQARATLKLPDER